jgi:phosphoenolpyruvate---glycerone phosphotransferase subunit DhaL
MSPYTPLRSGGEPKLLGMTTELDRSRLEAWLRLAASRLHEQRDTLVALDQAIGDGDRGTNMDRGFAAIVAKLDSQDASGGPDEDPAGLLRLAGKTLVSTVGGASGPLYGTGFLKLAASISGLSSLDGAAIVAALDAATNGIAAIGRSKQGEKTMLDALVPAVAAARSALEAGADVPAILTAARDAAADGAAATIPLVATKGRASYLGERSIGHQDPGATSAALILGALAEVASR